MVKSLSEFQNPQQESGVEKRLILVFALTFIVIIFSQQYLFKKAAPQEAPKQAQQQVAQQASAPAAAPAATAPATISASKPGVPRASTATSAKVGSAESETVVENDLYRITFTNRGGQVKSWILKKYTNDKGTPLELVHAYANFGLPLSIWTYDEGLRTKLNSVLYVPSVTGNVNAPSEISFDYSDEDITVRKVFRFDHSYVISTDVGVVRAGNYITTFTAWPAGFGDQTVNASYASAKIQYQTSEKINRVAVKKVSGGGTITGPFFWAGTVDQYFAAMFLPDDPQNAAMITLRNTVKLPKDLNKPNPAETIEEPVLGAAVGSLKGHTTQRLFVGPMDIDVLSGANSVTIAGGPQDGPDLRGAVDFGMFSFIARPLFLALKYIYKHGIGNWGWAIVVLTILINLALLPLRVLSMRSALKMQRIAPQIKSVQEKYKKYELRDPRRAEMQTEVSALYKQHNVNPAGGCLPMIIQMPFLFAFYAMLGVAIELRHANWLWVKDLASPDHLLLLSLGIVVTTLAVQKLTPTAGMDPAQQKMMTFMMPVFLGVMSYSLASGLSLYWIVGNFVAIIQQYVMNQTELGREMRATAAKQLRKK